ncbi:MAG TPA: NAD(P)-dependent oxidoreductase [Jiangellaceae bacterium]|nr:NAD(P)-dependent oxidoreductase [Jiangellaceae bacterium]
MSEPLTWVIGSSGLLGSHVAAAVGRHGPLWSPDAPIGWEVSGAADRLAQAANAFAAAASDRPWQVAWCAGAGVPATPVEALATEVTMFQVLLDGLQATMRRGSEGVVFLASSAGGVYAGSGMAPFDEFTIPRAISPYGEIKLRLEQLAESWTASSPWPVAVGRISNLYGPGQDLSKPQGLISQVCRAQLTREPVSIYVPLDTIRDYIFAGDCGAIVADVLRKARHEGEGARFKVKIIASQRGVTIGALLAELRRILKRRIRVVHGTSAVSRYQASDLRMKSSVWTDLDRRSMTPLPVGIKLTFDDLTRQLQRGERLADRN